MLWAILGIGLVGAFGALAAASHTRHLAAMILHLEHDKEELKGEIQLNRTKLEELQQDVFDLKMEFKGVSR